MSKRLTRSGNWPQIVLKIGVLAIWVWATLWLSTPAHAQGRITLTKTADKTSVKVNEIVTFTITVTNNEATAQNVDLIDVIPYQTTYVAGSVSSTPAGAIYDTGRVTWSDSLGGNQTLVVTFQVTVAQPSTAGPLCFYNTAIANNEIVDVEVCSYGPQPKPTPTPWPRPPGVIPEPSTLALLGGGLATLVGALRLRARRR